jgi:hypothetical protein
MAKVLEGTHSIEKPFREYYQAQGRLMTGVEAENTKLQRAEWRNQPFADLWRHEICRHVKEYVKGIPDYRSLPLGVPL